jgi:hypothetical protein
MLQIALRFVKAFVETCVLTLVSACLALILLIAPLKDVARSQQSRTPARAIKVIELSRTQNSVTLELDLPQPGFDTTQSGITLQTLSEQLRNGDAFAPLSVTVRASAKSSATIVSSDRASMQTPSNFYITQATAPIIIDGSATSTILRPSKKTIQHAGLGTIRFQFAGRARAVSLGSLIVGCYDYDASHHTLSYAKKVIVTLTDPIGVDPKIGVTNIREAYVAAASTFKSRLAAEKSADRSNLRTAAVDDVQQTPGIRADDGYIYRMHVNKDGIYHITFDDLKNFGLDGSNVDPTTLRVISQGQQVPVYVFDHQDGHFDPNDYFEFFGEEKTLKYNSKYGDEYYDPFTHYNVYYLVWGTKYSPLPQGGVKRLVEESGEIREADKSKFTDLRNSSFRTRLHFEHDQYLENLENTDLNDLSSLRDHAFTAQVRTAQSVSMDTITPYPDIENGKPFKLRIAFHGVSHFDPGSVGTHGEQLPDVPNEHQADVSVNGTHLLFGIWDSQVLKFLSTDTLSQRILQADPPPGILKTLIVDDLSSRLSFPLEVRVESKVKTDVQYCQFDVNWFDLDYDRLYAAYLDQIQFSVPKGSLTGLYQFSLSNFTRSDISIYRKGVSKISNMFIAAGGPSQNGIKAIFQLNVASDADQFYATVESQKLKPARYRRDSWVDLRDHANAGAYLIITDHDHLMKNDKGEVGPTALARLLAEHRSREGMTGMLIDVANIYDEFNFGARSPQAIKDFLTYAYNNWQDPPKAVLLAGTTHLGTDDTVALAPPEQVPTFYFQGYSYGATSTDTWLSLLDGDDLIPDILIGRIPSTSTAQDEQYVNKVIRYNLDAVPSGVWKDRALFVSGEHLNGNDFYGQITYLLGNSLPERIGIERLGLDLTLPYYGTDKELVAAINGGVSYVHFMGHGGLGVWADPIPFTQRSLFLAEDAARLTNDGHLPFIASLTCFTGAFDGSTRSALLPAMLLQPNAGAIAALGSSAFGFREEDLHLASALLGKMFDTLPASYGARVTAGKIDYFISNDPIGNLVDPTLMLSYVYLGDPLVSPSAPDQKVGLTLSTRAAQAGQPVTISGTTTLKSGSARIELMADGNEPFMPAHVIENVPITNGAFNTTDVIPTGLTVASGAYHVVVYQADHSTWGHATTDLTFTAARITELEFDPRPVDAGTNLTFSAAVQSPSGVQSVWAIIRYYLTDASGNLTQTRPQDSVQMALVGDRYQSPPISGSNFTRSMIVVGRAVLFPTSGRSITSDTLKITIGASADPAAFRDALHPNIVGRYRASPSGLVWQEGVYNWGSDVAQNVAVQLRDTAAKINLATTTIASIAPHSNQLAVMPVDGSSLDTASIIFIVQPQQATTPLALRDSSQKNDSSYSKTLARGAAAYLQLVGTTLTGPHQAASFDGGSVVVDLPPNAESNIQQDVLRVTRLSSLPVLQQYANQQPDIHFVRVLSQSKKHYAGIRIVSDSLGAIPLSTTGAVTLKIDLTDSSIIPNLANLYIYRQDDRSRQWSILPTARNRDALTATMPNLGNFAVAYHTDHKPPQIDMTVEGQVFVNNGDVPDHPHMTAVLQDANGIDITPGKTIIKVDGKVLNASQFAMLDSLRTPTTASLHFEPNLSDGTHTISVQGTDNNGNISTAQTLDVNVSHNFVVRTLGSYPNPFSLLMFLAYEIKGIPFAESVQLRIYTVSGRLIRTLQFPSDDPNQTFGFLKGGTGVPTSLGYHEVWWDGRDDGGSDVANGSYFFKLLVKTPSDEKDITGKFARVR